MKRPCASHRTREDPVDLNYLFFRQQIERTLADRATNKGARKAHEDLATMYEEEIEQLTGNGFRFPSSR
jgi:hypothetical protein